MKKISVFIYVIILILCKQGVYSQKPKSINEVIKKDTPTMTECHLTFGIPRFSDDYDSDNILFSNITIFTSSGNYKALLELRSKKIKKGDLVEINYPFSEIQKNSVHPDDINKIEVTFSIHQGGDESVRIRGEAVLKFSNGQIIATGAEDPAPTITIKRGSSVPKDGSGFVHTLVKKKPFYNAITLFGSVN